MYLKKTPQKTGRVYLSIVDGYYDKQKGYSRQITIEKLGYLDDLEKQYDDPIAFFTQKVQRLKEEKAERRAPLTFTFSHEDKISPNTTYRKNFGHVVLSSIYHELEINKFLVSRQRSSNIEFDTNNIMKLLTFSRLLAPASKKKTFEGRDSYFDKTNYTLDDVYRSLSFFNKQSSNLQLWLNERIKQSYGRDSSLVYYDVTNYYFETDKTDDFKKKGPSKEHRPNPIVQMGLFIDNNGIPITFQLFPGNTHDCLTYRPNLSRIKKEYDLGKVVVVADKGMTTGDNIWYTLSAKDGYVFSMSIRGADKELKEYVLNEDGYEWLGKEYKRKSRLYPRTIQVTATNGKKLKKTVHEKQVIFYSEKYDKRAKAERAAAITKAQDLIANPGKYTRATSHGAAGYVKNIDFDKETGEILTTAKALVLDLERLKEEEALDGYYAIVTSEHEETADKIIDMYRGLWRIEESFRVTKSDLEARPVYVSREDHIQAHFLTCFIALVIARILEMKMGHRYTISQLLESLKKCECTHLQSNHYLFDYYDDVLKEIGNEFAIDLSKRVRSIGEIKNILANTKK
ncbi:DDE family transposase [Anaerobacterium chartisolvens]|uniref:DDE family transposase n=1 Tax=Anaerobacterium chartisolvens TaxID=1297424 RepID=A0A369B918_9FIRM|nr:IS1634 family transposase [Anaerobacterium chartisolvens]RCX18029.1 DDE family transposase [Anaerobacterium chartisolvens]